MSVRAKFTVAHIQGLDRGAKIVTLHPVQDDGIPENQRFHQYTPGGEISLTIDNPPASDQFQLGRSYYVDFTDAAAAQRVETTVEDEDGG